jgi:hypothetical protein
MTTQRRRNPFPIYFGISTGVALLFLLATFLFGESYSAVERIGGALWIMFLALIITMVIVIPRVNQRNAVTSD